MIAKVTVTKPGTTSTHYPADEAARSGILDYEARLEVGGRVIAGGITLYRDEVNHCMSPVGDSRDCWISGELLAEIERLAAGDQRAVVRALAALSTEELEIDAE
jgi:hypothetical protein